jgi:hypothetical protein
MKGILLLTIILSCFSAQSQWERVDLSEFSNKILASEKKVAFNQNYRILASYKFYNSIESSVPVLEYPAKIMVLKGETFHIEQFNLLSVQNKELNVQIDTAQKTITVQKSIQAFAQRRTSDDFKQFLTSKCIVMRSVSGSITKFSIEFAEQSRFRGCDVWFDVEDQIVKYILYGSQVIEDDTDFYQPTEIQPKLEISYSGFQQGKDTDLKGFKHIEDFIKVSGKTVELLPEYSTYELIDLRVY